MIKDPIVEEVHKIREQILSDCGDDIEALMDRLKDRESRDKNRLVSKEMIKRKTPILKLPTKHSTGSPNNRASR
ncbi:MAG: hypothetical protein HY787_17575 [Deltaproteobacteria bacterium]|nr:hypothetical protein [Deltaproteobacteria bacterium]